VADEPADEATGSPNISATGRHFAIVRSNLGSIHSDTVGRKRARFGKDGEAIAGETGATPP
jgi:hypothetical protein